MTTNEGETNLKPGTNHSEFWEQRLYNHNTVRSSTEHPNNPSDDYDDYDDGYNYYDDDQPHHHNETDLPAHVLEGIQIYRTMLVAAIIPVCVIGIVANVVTIGVWNTCRNRTIMVLLFQTLAVLDSVFLLVHTIHGGLYYREPLNHEHRTYMLPVVYLSHTLSVHLTMIVGGFRWFAVARPQRTQRTMKRLVLMTCGGVGTWCLLLTLVVIVAEVTLEGQGHGHGYAAATTVLQLLGFVAPTLVLVVFSAALIKITCQHKRLQSKKKHQKTTLAVLSIAFCSFLACPVGVTGHLLVYFAANWCNWTCLFSTYGAANLLQVLNSSVNFLFYFFFASKFRPLLQRTLCRFVPESSWARRKMSALRKFSTTSSISTSTQRSTDTGSSLTTYSNPSGNAAGTTTRSYSANATATDCYKNEEFSTDGTCFQSQSPANDGDGYTKEEFAMTAAAVTAVEVEEEGHCLQEMCKSNCDARESGTVTAAFVHATTAAADDDDDIMEEDDEDITSL